LASIKKRTLRLHVIVCCLLVTCYSCFSEATEESAQVIINEVSDSLAIEVDETNSVNKECNLSKEFEELIAVLELDGYEVDSTAFVDTLRFQILDGLQVMKSRIFLTDDFNSVIAKRKTPLERMEENWFPNFQVFEICFGTEQLAIQGEQELSSFLESNDIYNSKNYDYLTRNKDRIIYVSCKAKIFEDYALKYKSRIEKIIKN
jgi:hypothetical protein